MDGNKKFQILDILLMSAEVMKLVNLLRHLAHILISQDDNIEKTYTSEQNTKDKGKSSRELQKNANGRNGRSKHQLVHLTICFGNQNWFFAKINLDFPFNPTLSLAHLWATGQQVIRAVNVHCQFMHNSHSGSNPRVKKGGEGRKSQRL